MQLPTFRIKYLIHSVAHIRWLKISLRILHGFVGFYIQTIKN